MSRVWGVFLLLALATAVTGQSAAAGLYNQANALYRQGDFEEARTLYEEAAASIADGRLYYNLGNACYKTGRIGEAILWYERALRLMPRDEDVRANLHFARQIKLDREPVSDDIVWDFFEGVFRWPSLNELCLVLLLGTLGAFVLGSRRLFDAAEAKGGWWIPLSLCLGVTAVAGTWLVGRVIEESAARPAIVLAGQTTARSGPAGDKTALFELHEGTKVKIDRAEGDWVLVRLPNGLGGWLPASAVEAI